MSSTKHSHRKQVNAGVRYRIIELTSGPVGYAASPNGLKRVFLPGLSASALEREILREFPDAKRDQRLLPDFAREMEDYFAGRRVSFTPSLDGAGHTEFQNAVWKACRRIPYGKTASYRDLAERVGQPRGARAVGMAMKRNPWPIVVPCHRVCSSDGSIGGYSGTGGVSFKERLLALEGRDAQIC